MKLNNYVALISVRRCASTLLVILTAVLLSACESPLVLERVVEQRQQSLQRTDLFQAATANDNVLVTVGGYGVIVVSTDGGNNWVRQQLDSQPTLIDATTCPDGTLAALAIEGQVWVSDDNGNNWISHSLESIEVPQSLTCDPVNRLHVVASFSTIMMSPDHGGSWKTFSFDEDMIFTNIQFFDTTHGLVVGEFGSMVKTFDGGQTWEMAEPMPDEFYPMASLFLDMNTGWVAGLNGTVFHTTDGGGSWIKQDSETNAPLYRLVKSSSSIYVVGDFGTLLEYQAEEEGRWVKSAIDVGTRSYLRATRAMPDGRLLLGGGAGVLKLVGPASLNSGQKGASSNG
ncbi:MAG: hypothetical protein IMF09_05275 [Proteobacteria bacterium]|nr:hypothetical protein [Pseudomonadota bacterium]